MKVELKVYNDDNNVPITANGVMYCICVSGRSWREKVEDIRSEMKKKDASALVVTALDEVACE